MRSTGSTGEMPLPDEVIEDAQATFTEGLRRSVMVNAYERNPIARKRCLEHWGLACMVCDLYGFRLNTELSQGPPVEERMLGYKVGLGTQVSAAFNE
jgi:5-methylcytosine-specific restriction enzyme A